MKLPLLVVGALLLVCPVRSDLPQFPPLATIGFHEGQQETITCVDGHLSGMAVDFANVWSYEDPVIACITPFCSSGKYQHQWTGTVQKPTKFGPDGETSLSASCPDNKGVTGLRWRVAKFRPGQNAEIRVSGIVLVCGGGVEMPLDGAAAKNPALKPTYDRKFDCHDVPEYKSREDSSIVQFEMWSNTKNWAGLEPVACSTPKTKATAAAAAGTASS